MIRPTKINVNFLTLMIRLNPFLFTQSSPFEVKWHVYKLDEF